MTRFTPFFCLLCLLLRAAPGFSQDFRVQIAAFGERMPASFFEEKGIPEFIETTDQMGLYRYFAGSYPTRDEAEVVRKKMLEKGFHFAQIIDVEEQRVLCGAGCPYFRNGTVYGQHPQGQETSNTLYFEFGRFDLTDESKKILDRFYEQLRDNRNLKLRIHGYADGVGNADDNRSLSAQRARAARDYLAYKGVRPDRMLIEQYGEANPILPNKDEVDDRTDAPQNRKWNRRVVLLLVNDFNETTPVKNN